MKPTPDSNLEFADHLEKFAASFIEKNYIDRWIHITLKKPEKASQSLYKFERHMNKKYCTMIKGAEVFPDALVKRYGNVHGVFFDGHSLYQCKPVYMPLSEAATKGSDAIFSIIPGKLAIFFFHEGWAWLCERK